MNTLQRLVIMSVCVCLAPIPAFANWCLIDAPRITKTRPDSAILVILRCSQDKAAGAIQYPNTTLYIGATLVKLDSKFASSASSDYAEATLDLEPITVPSGDLAREPKQYAFAAKNAAEYSHLVVAVGDRVQRCDKSYRPADSGCNKYKVELGRVDDSEYPVPVDTWPRPVCDVTRLEQAGFFKRVKDYQNLPRSLRGLAETNDCWNKVPGAGLGYSLRRWRYGPVSRLTTQD